MIFGNINHMWEVSFLGESIKKCFAYVNEHDLVSWDTGCHEIDGNQFFVNIVEYVTTEPENRFWEAHKEYLDVHVILSGNEQIDVNFVENMQFGEYVPKDDFLPLEGEKNGSVVLQPGDFLICYPSDAHRTAVAAREPEQVKKAIFKVKI